MLELCRRFPAIPFVGPGARALSFLALEPDRYMGMLVSVSLAAGAFAFLAGGSALAALAASAIAAALMASLPEVEMGRRRGELESELPLFLRSLGMLIELGVPYEKALETAARGCGSLEAEIARCLVRMRQGVGFHRSLAPLTSAYDSMPVRRAFSSLIMAYESGGGGKEIRRIGDDMLAMEQFRLREYASKGAIFGIVLIATSAILPTFFLVYSIAGLSQDLGAGALRMAMLVVFPLLSLLVIAISKSMMPRLVFGGRGMDAASLAPGAVVVAGYAAFPGLEILFLAAGALAGAYSLYRTYSDEKRIEEIERELPDALLSAGGMPRSAPPERLFMMVRDGRFGALSEEAERSLSQLRSNVPPGAVLDDLWRRSGSRMLQRACLMLRNMMDMNSLDKVTMLADDMIRSLQLKRERASVFSMQKYTLLAGALVIPLILRMALGLLAGMGGLLGEGSEAAVGSAESVIPAYLVAYSAISSAAIGDYEGKRSSAVVCMAAMALASLVSFHFIKF